MITQSKIVSLKAIANNERPEDKEKNFMNVWKIYLRLPDLEKIEFDMMIKED